MQLSPTALNRAANSTLGAVPACASAAYGAQATEVFPRLAACFVVAVCTVLSVRGYRLGVTCDSTRVTVRGYLHTRVIMREHITEVTDFPAIRWTARTGRSRWTPVTAFMTSPSETAGPRLSKNNNTTKLRRWATR